MFYFGHCVVCPLIYSFRLPIWYLETLLSMWHVLFWPLCCLSFFDLQLTTLCDGVCQWRVTGRWFSLDLQVSFTNKTDRHDIAEILLKLALYTTKQTQIHACFHSRLGTGTSIKSGRTKLDLLGPNLPLIVIP
jgi:hypothetical protein